MVKAFNSSLSAARKPMKRSPFLRKAKLVSDHKPRSAPKRSKLRSRGPKLEAWVRAIPESQSHGSGTLQKRLWRITSDYVRIRDWYKYGGLCIATGQPISHWTEGDAGHWKSYAVCNGLFKFDTLNIHLQSKTSNGWGGQEVGHNFGERLKSRYGANILDVINTTNRDTSLKFSTGQLIESILIKLDALALLPEQPDYYKRTISLLALKEAL